MKKIITFIFSVMLAATSMAAPWDGVTVASSYAGGTGTSADPYLIGTAEQLAYLSQQGATNTYTGVHFKLTADIDLNSFPWTPIGGASTSTTAPTVVFRGIFDGNNHVINNIYINTTTNCFVGLFSYAKRAKFLNIIIGAGSISGGTFAGSLAGRADSITIYNCQNNASVKAIVIGTSGSKAGGLLGQMGGVSTIDYSYNLGKVDGPGDYVGGLVGNSSVSSAVTDYSRIRNCYNNASVTGYTKYVGGICGTNSGNLTISECYNEGRLLAVGDYCGGIVGYGYGLLTILNCYNSGSVMSSSTVATVFIGGILGGVGGNAAGKYFKEIKNCYNTGALVGGVIEAIAGSLTGGAIAGSTGVVTNCYFVEHPILENKNNGGVMKTAADLITPEFLNLLNAGQTPSPWISNVNFNGGNPILAWQPLSVPAYTALKNIEFKNLSVYAIGKTIQVDLKDVSVYDFSLYSINGKLINHQKSTQSQLTLDVKQSGFYLVKITDGTHSSVSKVIVK
jgi:hypothetical protein